MIRYYLIIYVLLFIVYFSLLSIGIRLMKRYIANNADFRTINFVQFLALATFLAIEAFHYLQTGEANQMCILLTRNFLIFTINSYLNCKLLGYKNVYTKRGLRNILYVINNTLVYLTIAVICVSYLKVDVMPTKDYSLERIIQVLNFMGTDNYYPKVLSFIPIGYCLFTYIICIIMDKLEKRSKFTKLSSIFLIIPIAALIIDSTPLFSKAHYMIKMMLNSAYFTIPTLVMMGEALNIIYLSKKDARNEDDIEEIIKNAFKENKYNITKTGKIQAKVIAKEIQKNSDLLWELPKRKIYRKYRDYIVNLLEDPD